jgi:hypothetical protein
MKRHAHNSAFPREFRLCHSHATAAARQDMNGGTMTTGEKVDQRLPAGISLTSSLTGRKCWLSVSCPHEFKLTRRPAASIPIPRLLEGRLILTYKFKLITAADLNFKAKFLVSSPPLLFKLILHIKILLTAMFRRSGICFSFIAHSTYCNRKD